MKDRYIAYALAVRRLHLPKIKGVAGLSLKFPRLVCFICYDCTDFPAHVHLKREGFAVVSAHIVFEEADWGTESRCELPNKGIKQVGAMCPKDWQVTLFVPAWVDGDEHDNGVFHHRQDRYPFRLFDLAIHDTDNTGIAAFIENLPRSDSIRRLEITLDYDGPAKQQLSAPDLLRILRPIPHLALLIDPYPRKGDDSSLHAILSNISGLRQFRHVTLKLGSEFWDAVDSTGRSKNIQYLDMPIPAWHVIPREGPDPATVDIQFVFEEPEHIDNATDPFSLSHISRYVRLAASVMLLIGGPVAEYRVHLTNKGIFNEKYSRVLPLLQVMFERMLKDEIERLIEETRKGLPIGWRRLRQDERRALAV